MSETITKSKDRIDGDSAMNIVESSSLQLSEPSAKRRPPMSVSSDEVNYLVFRYLQECGFVHSAFSFVHESMLGRTGLRSVDKAVPPGALISFLQKGLQYVEIEERLNQENNDKDGRKVNTDSDFTLLSPAAMASLTRPNPPIQLNVPPAAAAAVVKARLEAEAKLEEERRNTQLALSAASMELSHAVNGLSDGTHRGGPASLPPIPDPNEAKFARRALAARVAAAYLGPTVQGQQAGQTAIVTESASLPQQRIPGSTDTGALKSTKDDSGIPASASMPMNSSSAAGGVLTGKRASSTAKRGSKKQKSSKSTEPPSGKRNASGFASLEEAFAHLEGKSNKEGKASAAAFTAPTSGNAEDLDQAMPMAVAKTEPVHKDQVTSQVPSISLMNGDGPVDVSIRLPQNHKDENNGVRSESQDPASREIDDSAIEAKSDEVLKLDQHGSEVFMCAWNPIFTNLMASGSGDASARIWEMGGKYAANGVASVHLLPHASNPNNMKNKDVTTLEWSSNGELLATGSYDGVARIWSRSGALRYTLRGHHGPIFSLKWNKKGNYVLSGSYDKNTIVWDVCDSPGEIVQKFTYHTSPALDVDWKDNETFASCSTDKTVLVCRVGVSEPIKVYRGHKDEVNGVKWDPSGRFLASCSDDYTAKVWDVESDKPGPLYNFDRHTEEIYTLKWSPNQSRRPLLATASFDGTVILWNIEDGSPFRIFDRHRDSVYSVAFSPSGLFLASGSLGGQMYIWDIEEGQQVKSYKGTGDIFEVSWNKEETRVASCFSSNVVAIVDFRKSKL